MKRNFIYFLSIIFVLIIIVYINTKFFKTIETFDFNKYNQYVTQNTTGEITTSKIIKQEIPIIYPQINSFELQFANYSNRSNYGTVHIKVYDGSSIISSVNINATNVLDGEFVKIDLNNRKLNSDILDIEITNSNSQIDNAVTLWTSKNDYLTNLGAKLTIDNKLVDNNLHIKINYVSPKINYIWLVIFFVFLWILIPVGFYKRIHEKYCEDNIFKNRVNYKFFLMMLTIISFVILAFRETDFILNPVLYGEDVGYLNKIFKDGFLESFLRTRNGGAGDFQNTGSFLMLYLALKTTIIFSGFNLASLPFFVGVYGNLLWAIISVIAYITFYKKGKAIGIIAFLITILIPMGYSGVEVFGRVVNTIFIWPVLATLILINHLKRDYHFDYKNILIGLICLVSGLSFPISYTVIGIYLIFSGFKALKEHKIKKWFISDLTIIISLLVGIVLLPNMMGAEGISSSMVFKKDSFIEFSLGRHFLYPFIYFAYNKLNDIIVIILFLLFISFISFAGYLEIKKKGIFNTYILFVLITVTVCISSIISRIKMTQLFDNYQSSFPDRYYYGCNILVLLLTLYGVNIILRDRNFKKEIKTTFEGFFVIILLFNANLFELSSPSMTVYGKEYLGTFEECLIDATNNMIIDKKVSSYIDIRQYPVFEDNSLTLSIPLYYAISTIEK